MKSVRFSLFTLLAAFVSAAPALCAELPPPTVITSTKLEMWSTSDGTETQAIFTGNVTVTGNEIKLTCDRLDIIADSAGEKNTTISTLEKFRTLIATGKVNIVQADREANCGRAEVYPRQDKIVLTEKPVVIDHSNGSVATGDIIEMYRGQRRVTGTNVHITLPAMKGLGFDKNQPAPKPETAPAPAPAAPTPVPSPTK